MANKNEKVIGFLNVFSWENFARTGRRYCHSVEELQWLLPSSFFKQFLTLQQEVILSDCVCLNPLVDYGKRNIYLKSKAFKKSLTEESEKYLKLHIPDVEAISNIFGSDVIENFNFVFTSDEWREKAINKFFKAEKPEEYVNWDDYVLKNSGYDVGRFHEGYEGLSHRFWVPGSDDRVKSYYSVEWQPVLNENEILKILFEDDQ